jgi:flagellar assembly protein FliH
VSNNDLTDEEIAAWELPFLEDTQLLESTKTNAINRQSTWKYEPPEEQIEISPPTAEEITAMSEAAYQEGFQRGQEEGHTKGYEDGKQQGFEQGKTEGFEEGQRQGLDAGEEEVKVNVTAWQSLLENLHHPIQQLDDQLKSELVKLSVSLARSVIRTEVTLNQDVLLNALSTGLQTLPIQENHYQIHMHPEDIELIKNHFSAEHIEKHQWVLVESPKMSRGGCDISTKNNAVDVSIERRVKDVLDRFLLEQGLSDSESE